MRHGMIKLEDKTRQYYRWHPKAECYQIAQEFGYNLGTALAYIWRVNKKGDPIDDIRKAITHLEFECARLEGIAQASSGTATGPSREQADEYTKYEDNPFPK